MSTVTSPSFKRIAFISHEIAHFEVEIFPYIVNESSGGYRGSLRFKTQKSKTESAQRLQKIDIL